jgi:3-dehydroquinate synthase
MVETAIYAASAANGSTQKQGRLQNTVAAFSNWEAHRPPSPIPFHYTDCLTRIAVKTASRSYEVAIARGLIGQVSQALESLPLEPTRVFVVTSKPIRRHWGKALEKSLKRLKLNYRIIEMPDGERAKRLEELERLAEQLIKYGADRHSLIFALGGGVVGDVGGFVASIFMRGIPVVQVPTTLVAQVDSAIGGKTGVNLRSGKNLLGTFHQPVAVLVDPDVLATLPEREYRSGLFEAMKYGVIRNPEIFETMEQRRDDLLKRDPEMLEWLIAECVRVKADVVSSDERESGERRILNFGHTIGHALEAETGYKHLLHGEAVGWGMLAAASIGWQAGTTEKQTSSRIRALVNAYGPLPKVTVRPKRILKRLLSDKKTIGGVPHFVLAKTIGEVEIVRDVPQSVILRTLEELDQFARPS